MSAILQRAHPCRLFGGDKADGDAPVGNGVVELVEHEADCREVAFLDRLVVVAIQRFPQHVVDLVLHGGEFVRGFRQPHLGNDGEQIVAMLGVLFALVPLPVVTQPGAGGPEPGENQDRAPDIVGIFFKEGAFIAVDIGRRTLMRRQRRVLVGIRLLDLGGRGHFPGQRLAHGEQLPDEAADRGIRQ